jgi:hypothetical protein
LLHHRRSGRCAARLGDDADRFFLPLLWGLSAAVTELPLIGEVSQGLVFVAIVWSILGTVLLAAVGIKLPGLEFNNQKVEAAYRKELVMGEDYTERAQPQSLTELFADVRRNYFRLYFNYMYFNVVRIFYLQIGNLVPFIALGPTIIAGTITLGTMQQIMRAFGRVEGSFQYLVNSWTTIVELMSVYKRLNAFEKAALATPESGPEESDGRKVRLTCRIGAWHGPALTHMGMSHARRPVHDHSPGRPLLPPGRLLYRSGATRGSRRDHPWPRRSCPSRPRGGAGDAETLMIMAIRYGANFAGSTQSAELGEVVALGDTKVSLHPAGHVLGSAQVLIEHGGHRLVASGDYKRHADRTVTPLRSCPAIPSSPRRPSACRCSATRPASRRSPSFLARSPPFPTHRICSAPIRSARRSA